MYACWAATLEQTDTVRIFALAVHIEEMLLVALSFAPQNEWIAARRFCQVYYGIFRVRHNLSPARISSLAADWVRGQRMSLLPLPQLFGLERCQLAFQITRHCVKVGCSKQ